MGKTTTTASMGYLLLSLGLTASFSVSAIWQGEPPLNNVRQEDEFVAACRENNLPAVSHYLTVEGIDPNKTYQCAGIEPGTTRMTMVTTTGLQLATTLGQDTVVDALIQAGADVNQTTLSYGYPPLVIASRKSNEKIVSLLLAAGADPHKSSVDGDMPLFQASWNNSVPIVRRLLRAKTDPNRATKDGETALLMA